MSRRGDVVVVSLASAAAGVLWWWLRDTDKKFGGEGEDEGSDEVLEIETLPETPISEKDAKHLVLEDNCLDNEPVIGELSSNAGSNVLSDTGAQYQALGARSGGWTAAQLSASWTCCAAEFSLNTEPMPCAPLEEVPSTPVSDMCSTVASPCFSDASWEDLGTNGTNLGTKAPEMPKGRLAFGRLLQEIPEAPESPRQCD